MPIPFLSALRSPAPAAAPARPARVPGRIHPVAALTEGERESLRAAAGGRPAAHQGEGGVVRQRGYFVELESPSFFGGSYLLDHRAPDGSWPVDSHTGYLDNATYWPTEQAAAEAYRDWLLHGTGKLATICRAAELAYAQAAANRPPARTGAWTMAECAALPPEEQLALLKAAKGGTWYDGWLPYCVASTACSNRGRMTRRDYGFRCSGCGNLLAWDLTRLAESPLNVPASLPPSR